MDSQPGRAVCRADFVQAHRSEKLLGSASVEPHADVWRGGGYRAAQAGHVDVVVVRVAVVYHLVFLSAAKVED